MTSRNVPFVRTDSGDPGAEAINASERHHVATAGHAGETARAETSTSATSVDQLAAMFQMFLIQQQERDEMWRKEAGKQEQRWRSLQHQFSQLQQVTQGERRLTAEESRATEQGVRTRILRHGGESTSGETRVYASSQDRAEPHAASRSTPRMPELKVSDDIENYLAMFERVAQTAGWPPEDWAIHLVPALDGKAREAYIAMDAADICNYVKVKEAILQKYREKETVLRWARGHGLTYRGSKLRVYTDLSVALSRKRAAYKDNKRTLFEKGVCFLLLYPARLRLNYNNETLTFDSPEEALKFYHEWFSTGQ
ncbi:hypothetical protein MHYP_G00148660 [Metynnis hypsauchen]